jgi:cytochrome c
MRLTSKPLALRYTELVAALVCSISVIAPQIVGAQSVTPSASSSPLPAALAPASAPPPLVSTLSFDSGLELARKKTCLGCHLVDSKRVGPSLQAVAQRHAEQSGSLEYLANAIRQGGRGRWGAVPMPAQPQVNQQDALQLAQWILNLR